MKVTILQENQTGASLVLLSLEELILICVELQILVWDSEIKAFHSVV